MKNKKILLICKETFSYPMYFLGKKLEEKGNEVKFYFIHSEEVLVNKNKITEYTYHYFLEKFGKNKIYDVKDIIEDFLKNYKGINPNIENLEKIEKIYGRNKNLNQQIMSSQMMTTPHHNRFFWSDLNYEQTLYWLELNYKKCEEVLNDFRPDVILDLDTAELQRTILNEVCQIKKIPYITLEYSRYESQILPTFNLGLEKEKHFIKKYLDNLDKNLEEEEIIMEKFNEKEKIMAEHYRNDVTSRYEYSLTQVIKNIIGVTKILVNIELLKGHLKKRNFKLTIPLLNNPIKYFDFFCLMEFRRVFLYSKFNKLFSEPKNENYVYMPLHLIPESTTFVKSPLYVDELSIIKAISKTLPIGWKLYVKEHQAMIGERPIKFYKEILRLYNVKIMKINHYRDPKPWITNSKGVITISGTTAFEARMLNKPSAIFGHVAFDVIDGVEKINSINELPEVFRKFEEYKENIEYKKSCAAYLKTIKEVGVNLDIKQLMELSKQSIISGKISDKLVNEIEKLSNFYTKAYKTKII